MLWYVSEREPGAPTAGEASPRPAWAESDGSTCSAPWEIPTPTSSPSPVFSFPAHPGGLTRGKSSVYLKLDLPGHLFSLEFLSAVSADFPKRPRGWYVVCVPAPSSPSRERRALWKWGRFPLIEMLCGMPTPRRAPDPVTIPVQGTRDAFEKQNRTKTPADCSHPFPRTHGGTAGTFTSRPCAPEATGQ